MTEYLITLRGDASVWETPDGPRLQACHTAHDDFYRACAAQGHTVVANAELDHWRSTVVRIREGVLSITDGPFTEPTEVLAGVYRIATDDLDGLVPLIGDLLRVTGETAEVRAII
ncbi:YciI family protein [Cellulomonas sp. URHE0023]|uniref:YciI family protein n=1 Tax=Cellulomonas sp. URHE0023 TaxID=1380354 RepID=UPI000488020B|nr:YciI family protein [Cellulomonas sp. URHE0023]